MIGLNTVTRNEWKILLGDDLFHFCVFVSRDAAPSSQLTADNNNSHSQTQSSSRSSSSASHHSQSNQHQQQQYNNTHHSSQQVWSLTPFIYHTKLGEIFGLMKTSVFLAHIQGLCQLVLTMSWGICLVQYNKQNSSFSIALEATYKVRWGPWRAPYSLKKPSEGTRPKQITN